MGNSMVKEFILRPQAKQEKVFGNKERELSGSMIQISKRDLFSDINKI